MLEYNFYIVLKKESVFIEYGERYSLFLMDFSLLICGFEIIKTKTLFQMQILISLFYFYFERNP